MVALESFFMNFVTFLSREISTITDESVRIASLLTAPTSIPVNLTFAPSWRPFTSVKTVLIFILDVNIFCLPPIRYMISMKINAPPAINIPSRIVLFRVCFIC